MKKNLFAIAVFAFLLLGCPNNISVNTSQNQNSNGGGNGGSGSTAPSVDDPNAKTILVVQNQSSISITSLKYCGAETGVLTPGGTWNAKFTDATQGYIYLDVTLGDSSTIHLRTQETVIIEKDKKRTFNITNNTIVIDQEKPMNLSAVAENFSLDGGIFLCYKDLEKHETLYRYFSDGIMYEIMARDNTYTKIITPVRYQGNVITFSGGGGSVQAKVTAAGMTLENTFFPRVTDPAIIQTIKNTPVSQAPQPPAPQQPSQSEQSLDGKICVMGNTSEQPVVTMFAYFSAGTVYGIERKDGVFTKVNIGMTYQGTIIYTGGVPEQIIVTDSGLRKPDGVFWPFVNDSEVITKIKALF